MSFTNYVPPLLNNDQAGVMPDLIGKLLGGYTEATKARYLQPGLEQELQKAKLFNQYYGRDKESQIGLRGAQSEQAHAHSGLLGEQTRGAHIENQYLPQFKQAQIKQLEASAQKAQLLQMIREQFFQGAGQTSPGLQGNAMGSFQGQGMPRQIEQGMQSGQMQQQGQQQQPNQPNNYAQAAIAQQALGLGAPKIVDVNGKYMAISPFGNVDTGLQGLSEQQKMLTKEDVKKISKLEDIVLSGSQKADTFNELNTVLGSKEFEELRKNPILGRHELGWYEKFGSREQQDLIGKAKTYMGNIIKDSAKDFAGQFRIGEQALLNDMKPNTGDTLDVMKGKSEALTFLNTIMTKRAELEADYMRNYGMSVLKARLAADKEIDPKAIKKEIRTILHPASSTGPTAEQARMELERRRGAGG